MITAGTSLLHYRVVEKIGEGGMGAVWKATALRKLYASGDTPSQRPKRLRVCGLPPCIDGNQRTENPLVSGVSERADRPQVIAGS